MNLLLFFPSQVVHAMWEKASISANMKMAQLAIMGETHDDITVADLENYHGVRPLHKRIISGIKNFLVCNMKERAKSFISARKVSCDPF